MGVVTAISLLVIAIVLFGAVKKGWISDRALQVCADIAGIVALLAAVAVFIVPPATPPATPSNVEPTDTAVSITHFTFPSPSAVLPKPQQVRWEPVDGRAPGICVDGCTEFIPWAELEREIQVKLLPQVARVPVGSKVLVKELQGKQNWIVQIVDTDGKEIGHIWFGPDPANNWSFDGLVRVGYPGPPVAIWDVFQRYSDGSYRKIR